MFLEDRVGRVAEVSTAGLSLLIIIIADFVSRRCSERTADEVRRQAFQLRV